MIAEKGVEKEESNIKKEEGWIIRETLYLKDFRKDVQEILELQQKFKAFQLAAQQGNSHSFERKLQVIHALIEKDENKFKKFRRVLVRSEKRKVRYERKVLNKIGEIEQGLDKPTKDSLNDLLYKIHVFSARVLTELSWRVGIISKLTSQQNLNLSQIKMHVEATLQACTALVALMERLEKFMESIENRVHKRYQYQRINPNIAGLTGYLKDGVIKTAAIKSIVPLKYFLEKGMTKILLDLFNSKYLKIIEKYSNILSNALTPDEIKQLKEIDFEVPEEATLIFLPGFPRPILSFNIHSIPDFSKPGWVFHSIGGEGLKMVSVDGVLKAPIEQLFQEKRYFTNKDTNFEKRILDGISFNFQDHEHARSYGFSGGFFIFPMKNAL